MRRRSVLGAAAVAAVPVAAVAASPMPHPDVLILALRDRCVRLQERNRAVFEAADALPRGPDRDRLYERGYRIVSIWHRTKWELGQQPARTLEGMRAKAEIAWHTLEPGEGFEPDMSDVLPWSLCRDLLGLNAA